MELLKKFWMDEDGMGVVEIALIIIVIIGIVVIFKDQINNLIQDIFKDINSDIKNI